MNVLDYDEVNRNLDDFVERIHPKRLQFKDLFHKRIASAVMVCSDNDFSLKEFKEMDAKGEIVEYFDLSEVKDGDYKLIFDKIYQFQPDGVLFDNIDKIPNISEKEDFEYLVQMALKRDTLPYDKGEIDFSTLKVGAKCYEYPEYLKGKSLLSAAITIC